MGKDKVGHPDLTGGAQTTLHSHPGGGNGAAIKAGMIITDGNGIGTVIFSTPFSNVNYAISFGCDGSVDDIIATWSNKTVNGFDVRTHDDGGKAEGSTTVDWVVIAFNNP